MKITCEIEETEAVGRHAASTSATCNRCGHEVFTPGIGAESIRRTLEAMVQGCPRGERNFYVADGGTTQWNDPNPG